MTKPSTKLQKPARPTQSSWLQRITGLFRESPPVPAAPAKAKTHRGATVPTKAESAELPPFPGLSAERILVPRTKAECEAAAHAILTAGVAGFDTESRPTFKAGEKSGGPHVVQFALTDRAFIFQLHRRECALIVARLIESDQVLKVGFGLKNDHGQIRHRLGVKLHPVIDLDQIFRKRGHRNQIGVRGAMAEVLRLSFPKSKSTTTSNWATAELNPRQLSYAANDAFAALKIMEALHLNPADFSGNRRQRTDSVGRVRARPPSARAE